MRNVSLTCLKVPKILATDILIYYFILLNVPPLQKRRASEGRGLPIEVVVWTTRGWNKCRLDRIDNGRLYIWTG